MAIKPILFSGPMVLALLEGKKTQTRRIIRGVERDNCLYLKNRKYRTHVIDAPKHGLTQHSEGDLLWVREKFSLPFINDYIKHHIPPQHWENVALSEYGVHYWAGGDPNFGDWEKPKPSIHMPRKHSRITLKVTGVRVESLWDISEEDAKAEGVVAIGAEEAPDPDTRSYVWAFTNLWDDLNKARGFGWDSNPWVSVTEFEVYRKNVDHMEKGAAG